MKIKRIKKLKVNSYDFDVIWNKSNNAGSFCYGERVINIGVKTNTNKLIFMILCHELMEISAVEMNIRLNRPDCDSDYMFVYDHRQHETMINMFSGLLAQFIAD